MEHKNKSENVPLISVIIATYNGARYLREAIESVIDQSYPATELIVVDDGSTDSLAQLIEPYIIKKMLRYIRRENGGPGPARNTGISAACGEYVAFIDDDDVWEKDKLQKQFDCMRNDSSCVACYTDARDIFPSGILSNVTRKVTAGYPFTGSILRHLVFHNFITLSSTMVKKDTLISVGSFTADHALYMIEDYDLWLKLAPLGDFCFVDAPLVRYRTRPPESSNTKIKNYRSLISLFSARIRVSRYKEKSWYLIGLCIVSLKYSIHNIVYSLSK